MSLVVFNLKLRNTNTQSIGNVEYDMPAGNFNSNMSLYPTPDINSSFYAYTNNLLKSFNIELLDHIIVTEKEYISMEKIKKFNKNYSNDEINKVEKQFLFEENLKLKLEIEKLQNNKEKEENLVSEDLDYDYE